MSKSVEQLEKELRDFLKKQKEKKVSALPKKEFLSKRKEVKESKREVKVKVKNFYLYVLREIANGLSLKQICKKYSISKQNLNWYVKYLKSRGFIIKVGYGIWEITQKGKDHLFKYDERSSMRKAVLQRSIASPKLNDIYVHSLRVKFPKISDNSRKGFWVDQSDLTYSIKTYHYHNQFTLEKTSKSIIVLLAFNVSGDKPNDFENKFNKELAERLNLAVGYMEENNIEVDRTTKRDIMVEYAIHDPLMRELRNMGFKLGEFLDLQRIREQIFSGGLKQDAYAKIDSTPQTFTRETNDRAYVKKVLSMPEVIDSLDKRLVPTLDKLTEQIELHLEVQNETKEVLKKMGKYFDREDDVDTVYKSMDKPTETDFEVRCPNSSCRKLIPKKAIQRRNNHCPACGMDLSLFPDLIK